MGELYTRIQLSCTFLEPLSWTVDWLPVNLEPALVRDAYLWPTGEVRGAGFCGCSLSSDLRAFGPICWRWDLCESMGAKKIREAPFWKVVSSNRHCPNSFCPPPSVKRSPFSILQKVYVSNIQFLGLWKGTIACFFWHCQFEPKSAQTILASILTSLKQEIAHLVVYKIVPQTIRANVYTHTHTHTQQTFSWSDNF